MCMLEYHAHNHDGSAKYKVVVYTSDDWNKKEHKHVAVYLFGFAIMIFVYVLETRLCESLGRALSFAMSLDTEVAYK